MRVDGHRPQQQEGFQGMTVQQQLEAHIKKVQQELDRQRGEVRLMQQQLRQQLLTHLEKEGLAWWPRPSY